MSDSLEPLILDLLEWLRETPRRPREVLEVWRTSCPHLPVWETAQERGLVSRDADGSVVRLTPLGVELLRERRGRPAHRVGVCAVLVRGGRFLMGHRRADRVYYPDVWDLIGGHVEPGETPEAALERELREEVGCVPKRFELLDVFPEPRPDEHGPGEFHVFVVREWSGDPRLLDDEHDELRWLTLDDLAPLKLADSAYSELLRRAIAH